LGGKSLTQRHWYVLIAIAAITFGIISAIADQWLCDDAFITFRYSANLVHGSGLVFNPGEKVEGYTNFLWGLWSALAMFLGLNVESWSIFWGIFFYFASLIVLFLHTLDLQSATTHRLLPVATLFAAFHPDWQIYATSGLETSFQTFLLIFAFAMLFRRQPLFITAGISAGLATLTRQDSFLFFLIAFLVLVLFHRKQMRGIVSFTTPYLVLVVPFVIWRIWYYSDIFPNTYYAKSANLTWYSQGFFYLQLYFEKYWIFGVGLLLAPISVLIWSKKIFENDFLKERVVPEMLFVTLFCVIYMWYLARVGGDFMFARMLVPLTPFLALALELTILPMISAAPRALNSAIPISAKGIVMVGVLLILFVYQGSRWSGLGGKRGVYNEWYVYHKFQPDWASKSRKKAEVLNRYFAGLPVRIGYFGGEARMLFYMPNVEGVECETGLTDYFTAHLPLLKRGRVGHEKKPPIDYLINQRKVQFVFAGHAVDALQLRNAIPNLKIRFDGIEGQILFWDEPLLTELKKRGAVFPDFPSQIDQYIANMNKIPQEKIKRDYRMLKRFYFDPTKDRTRELPFLQKGAL
jgi:hypothetical protein